VVDLSRVLARKPVLFNPFVISRVTAQPQSVQQVVIIDFAEFSAIAFDWEDDGLFNDVAETRFSLARFDEYIEGVHKILGHLRLPRGLS